MIRLEGFNSLGVYTSHGYSSAMRSACEGAALLSAGAQSRPGPGWRSFAAAPILLENPQQTSVSEDWAIEAPALMRCPRHVKDMLSA